MGDDNTTEIFSEEERDILQELMNIAFGNATADLAQVIDIYVELSVPHIDVITSGDLPVYMRESMGASVDTIIVDQKFWGDFSGSGYLVFPKITMDDLVGILDSGGEYEDRHSIMHREIILEIANILIGACVGKVCDLLNTYVTYSPPQTIKGESTEYKLLLENFDSKQSGIVMKTVFRFQEKDIKGFLLILTNQESIEWLRQALSEFMESYE
ncbi:MAG: chemotaxis protein CheC [Desulfobacterales bacterium]|nr:chemotaxis protein CheC [Desulfobacterales bacterium]